MGCVHVCVAAHGLFGLAASSAAAPPARPDDPTLEERVAELEAAARARPKGALDLAWNNGLTLTSATGDFQARIGGRFHLDAFFGDADNDAVSTTGGQLEDGTQFRRARIAMAGTAGEHFEFKWEYDFSDKDGKAKVMDLFLGVVDVENLPDLRIGHFKEPFGFEAMASANDLLFMERALPFAFVPFRNNGLQLSETAFDQRIQGAIGLFKDTNDNGFGQEDGHWAVTGRATGLPWCTGKRDHLIHVGAAASVRAPPGDSVAYKSKPEANLARDFVDTGAMTDVDRIVLVSGELAVLLDRLSLQGEWVQADLSRGNGMDDLTFGGWYAAAAWTLTGEPRRYRSSDGVLQMPRPARSLFAEGGGCGAWEVAARVSQIDLDDGSVAGGELRDVSVGLNWYPTQLVRVMLNLIRADLDRAPDDGTADILELRTQFAF